jgi:hypothetical protein
MPEYEPQEWQKRLPPDKEAAMRANGRRYRPPQSELDDSYDMDHSFIAIERQRRMEEGSAHRERVDRFIENVRESQKNRNSE